jgi:hypothetical protein
MEPRDPLDEGAEGGREENNLAEEEILEAVVATSLAGLEAERNREVTIEERGCASTRPR